MLALEEVTTVDRAVSTATLRLPIELPAEIEFGGATVNASSDGDKMPIPLSITICGLSGALSDICNAALRGPMSVGAKATLTKHRASTTRGSGQFVDTLKSMAFVPARVALSPVSDAVPVFVTITDCGFNVTPRF